MLRGGSKTPRNVLPVLSRHPFSHRVSRAPCQWDTQDQQGGGRRTPGVYTQMWKSHAFSRKRSILVVGFPPLCLFTDFFWSSFNIIKKKLLLLLGQLSACEKQLPVFPKIFFTSPAIFSHWSHPWDSANPLHLGWPGCCWCYTRDFPVGHCRICRIFIGCHCRKHENMNWMCTNVIGRCRMYQTTWTSNECAGTGTSLQSSVCRELRLDFGKPSLGVVSTPDKQRPLFHLG